MKKMGLLLLLLSSTLIAKPWVFETSIGLNFVGGNLTKQGFTVNSELDLKSHEASLIGEYLQLDDEYYNKYAFKYQYFYNLTEKFDLFVYAHLDHDSKRDLDFESKEVVGVVWILLPWLKYSLGVGHKYSDGKHSEVVSHRLKGEYLWETVEYKGEFWLYQDFKNWSTSTKHGFYIGHPPVKLGFAFTHDYDSTPSPGKVKGDWGLLMEVLIKLEGKEEDEFGSSSS